MFRRYLIILLCFLPQFATAQSDSPSVYVTHDSLPYSIEGDVWRFSPKDLPNGADTSLDDRAWPLVSSRVRVQSGGKETAFKGIGWLRLHFVLDSTLTAAPLVMSMLHYGASEVFLDGILQQRYGRLTPKDSAEYYNPLDMPFILMPRKSGPHVLAVRYAAWDYLHNAQHYNIYEAGFSARFRRGNEAIRFYYEEGTELVFSWVLLFGIFITLSIVHLILYLYYREERSNAHFSLFAGSVAALFLFPCLMRLSNNSLAELHLIIAECFAAILAIFSLSLMLNSLFTRRRWHLYTVAALCILAAILTPYGVNYGGGVIFILLIAVPLETVIILTMAIRRKAPGARILGWGLMSFTILFLVILIIAIAKGGLSLHGDIGAKLFIALIVATILAVPISMSTYLAWRFSSISLHLKTQLLQVEALSAKTREQEAERQHMLETRQEELEREVAVRTEELRSQKKKSDDLLLNILPEEIAEELKEKGSSEARLYDRVTVLFTDFVDFTQHSEALSPRALVTVIDECFRAFDDIITRHGLEKIKTVGDAYIAVSGLPAANDYHAQDVVRAALEIQAFMKTRSEHNAQSFGIRLGVHSGPVVAGIVGVKKFAYDIWGDTVNTAARMEQHSEEGKLNISATTYELVKDDFACTFRGESEVKHKGKMGMYFVEG